MYIPHNQYMSMMHRSLDATTLRHEVLANNIANIDTTDFKRSDVTFEAHLAIALQPRQPSRLDARRTNEKHFDFQDHRKIEAAEVKPYITREMDTEYRNDRNNVDPDFEATELAKNTMQYSVMAQVIKNKYREIGSVVGAGGGK